MTKSKFKNDKTTDCDMIFIKNTFQKNKIFNAIKKLESVSAYNNSISSTDLDLNESNKRFVVYQKVVQEVVNILNNKELTKYQFVRTAKEKLERFLKYNNKLSVSCFDELLKKIDIYRIWLDEAMCLLFKSFTPEDLKNMIIVDFKTCSFKK